MASKPSTTHDFPKVERMKVAPERLVKSHLHEDRINENEPLHNNVQKYEIIRPVLVRDEGGQLAVVEGWERVKAARESDKKVPIWLPEDGHWTDEKTLLARVITNTSSYQQDLNWLHRAWLLEDLWEEWGETRQPSATKLSERLDVAEKTARTWLEPTRNVWDFTIVDREMYDDREIRRSDGNDNGDIINISMDTVIKNVSPARLRDIRTIANTRSERVELLNSLAQGNIDYEKLKRTKERVENSDIAPLAALEEVLSTEPSEFGVEFEEETATSLATLADEKGLEENEVIKEQVTELLQKEGYETRPEDGVNHQYLGQQQYLNKHVEAEPPEPTLHMESNAGMSKLDSESVHLTVTSPPYDVGWEYGPDYDDSMDYTSEYLPMLLDIFEEVYRLTVSGGHLCLVVPFIIDVANDDMEVSQGTFVASDIAELLTTEGEWQLQDFVTWDKGYNEAGLRDQSRWPHPTRKSLNNFTEAIVVLKKPGMRSHTERQEEQSRIIWKRNSKDRDLRDNIWHIKPATWEPRYTDSGNTAQFPEKLAKRCLLHYSYVGDTVLDPFCGRGTTLKMAKQLYRESVGYEIQEELERGMD
jgi:DNA modification methylase